MSMRKTKKDSAKQESRAAEILDGRTVIASGAFWDKKSDVVSEKYRVECKITGKEQYSLKLKTWSKIREEALKSDRQPLMFITLTVWRGVEPVNLDLIVFDFSTFGYFLTSEERKEEWCYKITEKQSAIIDEKSNKTFVEFFERNRITHSLGICDVEFFKELERRYEQEWG